MTSLAFLFGLSAVRGLFTVLLFISFGGGGSFFFFFSVSARRLSFATVVSDNEPTLFADTDAC